jgi:hypothetical protein
LLRHHAFYAYMTNLRAEDQELQVVAKAAWVLAHIAQLQPIYRLI